MDDMHPVVRHGYLLMAAIAGSVTALSFKQWKSMSYGEIWLTLFVGASFAIFVAPLLAEWLAIGSPRGVAALTYISASGSNVLIPVAIKWLKRVFGPDKELADD